VNSHTTIEILLGRAHLDGQSETLHHFITALAEDVESDDLFVFARADELELGRFLLLLLGREDVVVHGGELCVVDLDVLLAVLFVRLGLGEAGGADLGVGKDDGGDLVVLEVRVFELGRAEEAVAQVAAGRDGDRGQFGLAGHVAQGVDAWDGRVLVLVDDDVALLVELDVPKILQTQLARLRAAADGPEELVGRHFRAVVHDQLELFFPWVGHVGAGLDLDHLFDAWVVLVHVDSQLFVVFGERLLDHGVEFAEEGFVADEEVGFDADGVHDAGKLDGDVSCSYKYHLLW